VIAGAFREQGFVPQRVVAQHARVVFGKNAMKFAAGGKRVTQTIARSQ